MIKSNSVRSVIALSSLLALAASSSACSAASGEESVGARVETIDRTHQALTSGAFKWANGTYGAGCTTRSGKWSAPIGATDPATMPNAPVSVVKGNGACRLTLTELEADATYGGTPSILMAAGTYAATGSSFAAGAGIGFYANAQLSSLAFTGDFTMTILFSDTLADTNSSVTATYASVSGTASASALASPEYTADFGFTLQTDEGGVVQLASGYATMMATGQSGESYVVDDNQTLGATFDAIDAAYKAGTAAALGATIAASDFSLAGAQLPTVRNILISHTDSGVTAYEVIRVTFNAP